MDGVKNLQVVGILTRQDAQMQQELMQNADGKILDGAIQKEEDFQQEPWLGAEEEAVVVQLALIAINMTETSHYAQINLL